MKQSTMRMIAVGILLAAVCFAGCTGPYKEKPAAYGIIRVYLESSGVSAVGWMYSDKDKKQFIPNAKLSVDGTVLTFKTYGTVKQYAAEVSTTPWLEGSEHWYEITLSDGKKFQEVLRRRECWQA